MKFLLIMMLIVSCSKIGTSVSPLNAKDDFEVTLLFTQNECSVYRFIDVGSHRYFTNCQGSVTSRVSCGKNCTRDDSID